MNGETLSIIAAEYAGKLSLKLTFSDGTRRVVEFGHYLRTNPHPQHNCYLDPEQFKKFHIDNGNVVWGKDWDMIFPIEDLYSGTIK